MQLQWQRELKEVFHERIYILTRISTDTAICNCENEDERIEQNVEFGFWEKCDDNHTVVDLQQAGQRRKVP